MERRPLTALALVLSITFVAGACSYEDPELRPAPPVTTAPTTEAAPGTVLETTTSASTIPAGETLVATAKAGQGDIGVADSPGGALSRTIENPSADYGAPQVFVVRQQQGAWIEVELPARPNGSTGWIRIDQVDLSRHDYRIRVWLGEHRIEVSKGGQVLLSEAIGVGTSDTPTPARTYYTWVLIAPTNSGYGSYAYGLSGFSEKLDSFAGSDARLGIHGTTDESSIGRDVSHGCIRVSDPVVKRLVEEIGLPLGVPVEVNA